MKFKADFVNSKNINCYRYMTLNTNIPFIRLFLIAIIGIIPLKKFGQQYNFKNYSVESGLPYVQIFSMFQDSKGYLWSGGYGGASKFNGKTFKNYSPKNGLANHYVNAITEDLNNNKYIGTIEGLSRIDKITGNITNYTIKNGLPSNHITSFCLEPKLGLWTGTTNGLCIWNETTEKQIPFFKNYKISALLYSEKRGLLVATSKGLFIKNKEDKLFSAIIEKVTISSMALDGNESKLYIGTDEGLYIYDFETKKTNVLHVNNGLIEENITSVICQKNGAIWIGSKFGLISFDGLNFSYYDIGFDNNSNYIRSLLIDYEDNLWIGTHSGLYKYRGKGFSVYDRHNGLGSAFIYQIINDTKHHLWVATENDGVFEFADGFFKRHSEKDGLSDNRVSAILPLQDESIWAGTNNGISVFKNNRWSSLDLGKSNPKPSIIKSLFEDSKNIIWVGCQNLLLSIKKNANSHTITNYTLPISSPTSENYSVWSFIEDENGDIWAGTHLAGLFKLVGNQFIKQNISATTSIETALDLCKDKSGNLYAATMNGVLIFNDKKKTHQLITEKDGLSSELVYAIGITKDNKYVWAGTNQGINRINVDKLHNGIIDIIKFGKADGFSGVESNTHGIFEDDDSCIWFGTVNGLIKYNPKEFIRNDNLSRTTISNIRLGYADTILENNSILPYSLNTISFYFDGICLTSPEKVLYSYKLEGYDKVWSPNTDANNTKYNNLPPGKYTFKVKSCNDEGAWNIEPTTFSFTIKAPFYQTWIFLVICIISATTLVILVFRLRLKQLKQKQQLEYEHLVEVSKAEMTALRSQMNPHFIFNALNSIQHYILTSKGDEAVKYLSKFAKLIRIILNNSEKHITTINEDVEAIRLYLELEQMRFENKFEYTITIDDSVDGDYDEIPPMLIQPYLENAILHGINPKEGIGHIFVTIKIVNQFIKITIRDDGIGREKSNARQSIPLASKHQSLGMKITKDRVRILNKIHQSNLSVTIIDLYNDRKESIGTQVDLFIPYLK